MAVTMACATGEPASPRRSRTSMDFGMTGKPCGAPSIKKSSFNDESPSRPTATPASMAAATPATLSLV